MQIHFGRSRRLGFVRSFPAQLQRKSGVRVGRLGQVRQDLVFAEIHSAEQVHRTHRILELRDRLSGRIFVRFGRQRLEGDALGLERKQTLVHFGSQGHHQRDVLLSHPVRLPPFNFVLLRY
jgi:hypothetical protein